MHCPSSWCHPWVLLLPCHISTHLQVIKLSSEVYLLNILSVASPLPLPSFHHHLLPRVPWQLPNLHLPVFRLTSFIQSPFYSINILKHKCYPIGPVVETSSTGVSFPNLVNHALHSLASSPELSLLPTMLPEFQLCTMPLTCLQTFLQNVPCSFSFHFLMPNRSFPTKPCF